MRKIARVEGLNDFRTVDFQPWRDYQRWLAAGERRVVVPFAEVLAELIPPRATRLRRDFGQLLRAIKTHALMHRAHRERNEAGEIVATIEDDYEIVRWLTSNIISEAADARQSTPLRDTVMAVVELLQGTEEEGLRDEVTRHMVAEKLKLSEPAARRRLNAAEGKGFIANAVPGKGRTATYKLGKRSIFELNETVLPSIKALARKARARNPSETDDEATK